ncbi:hypothetical protein G6F42_012115 [Rhizopus arrhizus]|nr:hypothetical protein G6F42_012115 [Rhizopus arrhizus]
MAKRHYTSKLVTFDDLETIASYGFRGEALNSICAVSDHVIVMTKTKADVIGKQYDVDKEGTISNEKPTNTISKSGTVVTLYKPFYNLPVRRQLAQKNITQNNKKFQDLLIKYALAHPQVRFSSHQARDTVGYSSANTNNSWIKPVTTSIHETMTMIYGSQLANMVERFVETDASHPTLTIDLVLPKRNSDPSVIYKGGDRVFIYVNQRPINYVKSELKEVVTSARDKYREAIGLSESNKKNPFVYMDIQIPPDEYDVNIEPNKTIIYFHHKELIYNLVQQMLNKAYPSTIDVYFNKQVQNNPPTTMNVDQEEEPLFVSQPPSVEEVHVPTSSARADDLIAPAATSPSPPANMDHSWSFSMLSDDEEEEEPLDVIVNATTNKPKVINTTSMANWQIDTVSSVAGPTAAPRVDVSPKPMHSMPENDTTARDNTIVTGSLAPPSRTAPKPTIPAFTIPQKRALSDTNPSDDDISIERANKRISMPYINRQRETSASLQPLDIVEDFIPPPSKPPQSTIVQSSPEIPAKTAVSAGRLTSKSTFVSPSIGRSTTNQQRQRASPAITLPTQSRATHQLGLLEAFKQKACIQNKPSSIAVATPATSSTSTQNQSLVIQWDFDQIKANYPNFKKQHDKTHLLSIEDYLATYHEIPDIDMNARLVSTTAANNNGLSFYSRGGIFELGVVKLKALGVNVIYKQLLKGHKVICKRRLNRPVQIQFQQEDPLCAALIALDTKEEVIDDDLHGNKEIAYYDITEDCVVNNGFHVRWRKDQNSHNLIIQFTGIYALESGYGPSDFREILSLLADKPNSFVRPEKIRTYLWSVAEEMYEQNERPAELQDMLQELKWSRGTTSKDSSWELARSDNGHLLACRFSNATTYQP